MQSIDLSRSSFGCARISRTGLAVFFATLLVAGNAAAQKPEDPQRPAPTKTAPEMPEHIGAPTSLRDLLQEAEQKNPQIAASFHAWQASRYVPKEASALPETQLSVQQFSVGSPRPFAGYSNSDFAYIGFGASQDIPYPGKRALRSRVAEQESESMEAQTDSVRRTVAGNLKMVYFQLAYIQQTLGILQKSDELLNQVEQAAEARYRVGQGNQQDVLKAQLQHTKILQEVAHHHQEEGLLEAQIKQLLGRSQESPDIVAETLTVRTLPYAASDLLQHAREQNPDIRSKQASIRQQETQVELAHSVLSEVQQQYVRAKTAEERLKIYSDGLVPQSEATFRSALSAYQSNRQDFQSLLSSFLDVLNLDLEYRSELVEHESALAELERLTGLEVQ